MVVTTEDVEVVSDAELDVRDVEEVLVLTLVDNVEELEAGSGVTVNVAVAVAVCVCVEAEITVAVAVAEHIYT